MISPCDDFSYRSFPIPWHLRLAYEVICCMGASRMPESPISLCLRTKSATGSVARSLHGSSRQASGMIYLFKQHHTTKFTSESEMMSMPLAWKLDSCRDKQRRTITVQRWFVWSTGGDRSALERGKITDRLIASRCSQKEVVPCAQEKASMPSQSSIAPRGLDQQHRRRFVRL